MTTEPTKPDQLSLIVVSEAPASAEDHVIHEAGPVEYLRNLIVHRKDVSLVKVEGELDRVQPQIDAILSKIDSGPRNGYKLSEIEVSLSISAEGSIGIVTAGAEVGIALTFTKA